MPSINLSTQFSVAILQQTKSSPQICTEDKKVEDNITFDFKCCWKLHHRLKLLLISTHRKHYLSPSEKTLTPWSASLWCNGMTHDNAIRKHNAKSNWCPRAFQRRLIHPQAQSWRKVSRKIDHLTGNHANGFLVKHEGSFNPHAGVEMRGVIEQLSACVAIHSSVKPFY